MDLLNNLVFTALNNVGGFAPLTTRFFNLPLILGGGPPPPAGAVLPLPQNRGNYFSYDYDVIEEFCALDDADFIGNAIEKHWADMVNRRDYVSIGGLTYTSLQSPPYHLIYAYLVENTRIVQIIERLLYLYMHDEKLNKASTAQNRLAFQWMMNTESLFYKYLSNTSYRNISSQVRFHPESTRRNVYFRMFGIDLAFGELQTNATINYHKAEFNNQPFIPLFEKFLREIWQAYTNARNQVGPNTTDMFSIVDTAQKIQELLMARRTTDFNFNNYRYFNLSKEEYSAAVMMSWFYEMVSYDEHPVIQFLRCNGGTPGERLINIGNKVGVNAHSKSEGLLEIAPPMNTLLRRIELGDYNQQNEAQVRRIIESQTPGSPASAAEREALNDLLLIINNWEKATGHKIKDPDVKSNGAGRIDQRPIKIDALPARPALSSN